MNILVTGASGFLGYHLVSRLLAKGHNVTGTIRRAGMASSDSRRRMKKLEAINGDAKGRLQIARSEEFEALYNTFKRSPPEICIHLAGKSWVRESVGYPELYEEANFRFTAALLEALRQGGCRRIVFASTVMVYGNDAPLPYSENELGSAPSSPYGASKLACEVLVNTYRELHMMETINLRLFSVYGPDLRPDCVPHLIASAIMKGQPFTVFGDGSSVRDYIEVDDVLDAIEASMALKGSCDALNIGSGFGVSLMELIETIQKAMRRRVELIHKPLVQGELQIAVPDITMAMNMLDWEPKVDLDQGIARMAAWFQSPDGPGTR